MATTRYSLPFARPVSPIVEETGVQFLNKSRKIETEVMDWRCADEPKLWRYNLHYFDYLHWDSYSPETKNVGLAMYDNLDR